MTAMEMKRWAAREKERARGSARRRRRRTHGGRHGAHARAHGELERASAIHLWHVERGYAPTARNPRSNVTSAMGELALGTSTATSQFAAAAAADAEGGGATPSTVYTS